MRAHLWRDRVLLYCGNGFRRVFNAAVGTFIIIATALPTGTLPVHAGDGKALTERPDTEHLFGFVEGADIGGKGEAEAVIDSILRAGRSAGTFADTASEVELKYTAFDSFRISGGATFAYYDIASLPGIADARRAAVQSLFVDVRYRLLDRDRAPFGLTLSASPHWGLVDETSGVLTRHFGAEIRMLADRELVPDRVAGAVNFLFANDRARLRALDGVEHESLLGAGVSLAAQISPGLWLGGEARYLRDYSGAALNVFSGQAAYVGPTVYTRFGSKAFVSAALEIQVWGNAVAAPGALDFTNFERIQGKLRFGFEF